MNFCVITAKSRSAPSSWLDEVRSLSGQFGQVSSLFSFSGGFGMISKLVTLSAPWRIAVPMQSEPVSPPPITTTCLRAAEDRRRVAVAGSPAMRRFCCGRYSMAKWMPLRSRPGIGRSREASGAAGEHHRVEAFGDALDRHADADMRAVMKHHALGFHLRDAPRDVVLLHLEVRNAVGEQPAGAGELLEQMHLMAGARELLRAGQAGGA